MNKLLILVAKYPGRVFSVMSVRDTKLDPITRRTLNANPDLERGRYLFTLRDIVTREIKSVYISIADEAQSQSAGGKIRQPVGITTE